MNSKRSPIHRPASLPGLACLLLAAGLPVVPAQAQDQSTPPASRNASRAGSDDMSRAGNGAADHPSGRRGRNADAKFLMKAHASGMRELQLSQLAAERATDPGVRSFAQEMVSEHQQMAQDIQPLMAEAAVYSTANGDRRDAGASAPAGSSNRTATAGHGDGSTSDSGAAASGNSSGSMGNMAKSPEMSRNMADNSGSPGGSSSGGMRDRWTRMMDDRKQKKLMEKSGADFDKAYMNLMVDEHEAAVDLFQDGADDTMGSVQAFAVKYLPKLQQHLDHAEQVEKSLK